MSPTESVTRWIHQVKEGKRGAAVERLLDRYFQRLIHLARKELQAVPGLAGYEEDVALHAFNSFCLGAERGCFTRLLDRDDLWRLLATITIRKAIDLMRKNHAEEAAAEPDIDRLLSREPSPELVAEMTEEHQRLFRLLADTQLQAIAHWKVEGYTHEEIARRLGCVPRTVERKVDLIRKLWSQELLS